MANYANERINSPSLEAPVRPPATIPTPNSYQEAMRPVDSEQWKAATAKEINSLTEHEVADLVAMDSLPSGAKAV